MIVKTKFVPIDFDAFTVWPFIFVRPEVAGDQFLIEHEKVHLAEQKAQWVIPWLLKYGFSKQFRFEAEVRAYKVQLRAGSITYQEAAKLLMLYNLNISYQQALTALHIR